MLLDALDEPALVLTPEGLVAEANRAALHLMGRPAEGVIGRPIGELVGDPPEHVLTLLRRTAGSGQVTLGAVTLRIGEAPPLKLRWRGRRFADAAAPRLLLRLAPAQERRFSALTQKIVALNEELARNRRIQQELRIALAEKEMLFGELNHRVKNNIQTLLGIILLAERRLADPGAIEVLEDLRRRVEAIGTVQRLLYRRAGQDGIEGRHFLDDLCGGIERGLGRPELRVEVTGDTVTVGYEIASALGLIVNELVTNAFKHAFAPGQRGVIRVGLSKPNGQPGQLVLTVEDDGRGLDGKPAGTGLDLVRGLARQLDGRLELQSGPGLRCAVTLGGATRPGAVRG